MKFYISALVGVIIKVIFSHNFSRVYGLSYTARPRTRTAIGAQKPDLTGKLSKAGLYKSRAPGGPGD